MSKAIPAYVYGAKKEAAKEKVIFRMEYDPYMKMWGYLAGFPNAEANRGRIGCLPFKIYENGKAVFEPYTEVDKFYFLKKKLVHKGTEEAERCLKALKDMADEEDFVVVEKIVKGDRCY